MRLNIEYEKDYNDALKVLAQATRELNVYLESSERDDNERVHYLTEEEGILLDQEHEALEAYRSASKIYFGEA